MGRDKLIDGPKKFRKLPVEIEAIHWDGTATGATIIIDWVLTSGGSAVYRCAGGPGGCPGTAEAHFIAIRTREGEMRAEHGDWIIREPHPTVDRKFYPCKPDIFAATYEAVE